MTVIGYEKKIILVHPDDPPGIQDYGPTTPPDFKK
jgi:hypothetical protein